MDKRLGPTDADIRDQVDRLITPELADGQCEALTWLLTACADTDDPVKNDVYEVARRHAFTKTSEFEDALNKFTSFPAAALPPNPEIMEIGSVHDN